MIKVLQYGEGNFLRTFVDAYFDTLNKTGAGEYSVDIVKPIPFGSLEKFEKQEISESSEYGIGVCGFAFTPDCLRGEGQPRL